VESKHLAGLRFLGLAAKVATEAQLYRATGIGRAGAKSLARTGLIERRRVLVNPPQPLPAPVATFEFEPGRECVVPDFEGLSRRLKGRQPDPLEELFVVFANRRSAELTGGVAARIKPLQLLHDLLTTEALIAHGVPLGWRSEDFLARDGLAIGEFLPDAALVEGGRIVRAFEYGGLYEPERIEAMWLACYLNLIPLELW
jgi:hypothetical protein